MTSDKTTRNQLITTVNKNDATCIKNDTKIDHKTRFDKYLPTWNNELQLTSGPILPYF